MFNTHAVAVGTGFCIDLEKISLKGFETLINKTRKVKQTVLEDVDFSDKNLSIYEVDMEVNVCGTIADALNEIFNVESFIARANDYGDEFVIFADKSPWDYTENEKKLTKSTILEFFTTSLKDVVTDLDIDTVHISKYLE